MTRDDLLSLASNAELLEVARLAIEDELIRLRDARIFTLRNNGLVCKEYDGTPSEIIRMGPEHAMALGLRAIAEKLR